MRERPFWAEDYPRTPRDWQCQLGGVVFIDRQGRIEYVRGRRTAKRGTDRECWQAPASDPRNVVRPAHPLPFPLGGLVRCEAPEGEKRGELSGEDDEPVGRHSSAVGPGWGGFEQQIRAPHAVASEPVLLGGL